MFDSYSFLQNLWLPEDGCGLQSKHDEAVKLAVQLVGNKLYKGRSQWPRGLRRESAAARLLGLRVRISLKQWMFSVVYVACCVGIGLCDRPIARSE
jgi:hypothetical protein